MPITVNEGGVIHELETITVNVGGTLHELDTIHANNGGVLHEIYSGWKPPLLTWSVDTTKDKVTKINSVSNNGYTVTYTGAESDFGTYGKGAQSNYITLPEGSKINVSFSNAKTDFDKSYYNPVIEQNGKIVFIGSNGSDYIVPTAGDYRIALKVYGNNSDGSVIGSCTVTAEIKISK